VKQTTKPLRNSSETNINSYNGHHFVARFLNDVPGVEAYFTKGPKEENVLISYNKTTKTMSAKHITKFDEIMDLISEASGSCDALLDEAFTSCIREKVMAEVVRLTDTTKEIERYRDLLLPKLQEYVCNDERVNMTEPFRTVSFEDRRKPYTLNMFVDSDTVKVFSVDNAVSEDECSLLMGQTSGISLPQLSSQEKKQEQVGGSMFGGIFKSLTSGLSNAIDSTTGISTLVATSVDGSTESVAGVAVAVAGEALGVAAIPTPAPMFKYAINGTHPEMDGLWCVSYFKLLLFYLFFLRCPYCKLFVGPCIQGCIK
jgi:hypothetical protein